MAVGSRGEVGSVALVDGGALHTVIDESLARELGAKYTGLIITLTSFSGHRMRCSEAILDLIAVEDKRVPHELVAVCKIPNEVRELLKRYGADERVVIGVHSLEHLGLAIDLITQACRIAWNPVNLRMPILSKQVLTLKNSQKLRS